MSNQFLTLKYVKTAFGITSDNNNDRISLIVNAANTAVENAIRAKNPDIEILDDTQFFNDARDVALIHFESNMRRQINHLYKEADDIYKNYEEKLAVLIEAIWETQTPREFAETQWEEEVYRPFGQDFGVPIDY